MNAPLPISPDAAPTIALKDPRLFRRDAYVDGAWTQAADGAAFAVHDPATGARLAEVADLGPADTARAIAAADAALPAWRAMTAKDRGRILRKWYELILEHADDLALILTTEMGKPLAEAKGEILYGASFIEWYAEEGKRAYGDVIPTTQGDKRYLVMKQGIGVCAAITPWNFPNAMITRKVAPGLAVGCTFVLKPAEQTPLSALALAELAERAGLPKGVLNIVTSNQAPAVGQVLTQSPVVKKVTFTGSTEVGRILMRQSADTIKKLSLELGGNAPFIVFDDADLDAAADGLMNCKFRNAGQTCISANRIYVQAGIYDAFAARVAERMRKLKVGRGTEPGVTVGPLIDSQGLAKVKEHVADATTHGARVLLGGRALDGLFHEPTLLVDVTRDMRVSREETFGPVAPMIRFATEAEAIALANSTEFGLAAYFYSKDVGRCFRVAEAIESGMVGVNVGALGNEVSPFGGVKQSGLGREGSRYGIDDFLEIKYVCLGV
jgi:succinate-semialdehyde dehydrogenase / glutarate-semialdehyde dehydrogenase